MGEYYDWVNVDRREYICPTDFDLGNKSIETSWRGNAFLCALRDLLSNEWAGDHVFFMGDEKDISKDTENATLQRLYEHTVQLNWPGEAYDTVLEMYTNVSGLFIAAEEEVRQEIGFYLEDLANDSAYARNEYGINRDNPYVGLFSRTGKDFRYTLNHTKKVCYSLEDTKILYEDGTIADNTDPLPMLMAYGRVSETGIWVGDIIGVSDEAPEGYEFLEEIYLDW